MPVIQFNIYGSLYPALLEASVSLVMYIFFVGMHIVCDNLYTNICKSDEKDKKEVFSSTEDEPLIVLDYWSKNIEEYFHTRHPKQLIYVTNLQHIM